MVKNILFKGLGVVAFAALGCSMANAQGTINTVAGDGYKIAGSDHAAAANVSGLSADIVARVFSSPGGVATDAAGTIYVADYSNHSINVISPSGGVSNVSGVGVYGFSGFEGITMTQGVDYSKLLTENTVQDNGMSDFYSYCSFGAARKPAKVPAAVQSSEGGENAEASAQIEFPKGIWKDQDGNLLIADHGNNRICKVNAGTNTAYTITGGSAHGFSPDGTQAASCLWGSISGICADNAGNIFVADRGNHVVRMIDPDGVVRTIAGTGVSGNSGDGGFALNATFRTPGCLFMNNDGNLFICDPLSNVVRVMNPYNTHGSIETLAGTGKRGFSGDGGLAAAAQLNYPSRVWQDADGMIYIADIGNLRVRSIAASKFAKGAVATFSIFPNPSNGSFIVKTSTLPGTLDVFNVLGEKVYTETITQPQTTVKLNQPFGVYDIVVKSGSATNSQKIVIEK